jgi:hypothetical protein
MSRGDMTVHGQLRKLYNNRTDGGIYCDSDTVCTWMAVSM